MLTCLYDGGVVPGNEVREGEDVMLRLLHRPTLSIRTRHLLEGEGRRRREGGRGEERYEGMEGEREGEMKGWKRNNTLPFLLPSHTHTQTKPLYK